MSDLREKLAEALETLNTAYPTHPDEILHSLLPIIEQHYAGPPPGWTERVEAATTAPWPGARKCTRRVWSGPWREGTREGSLIDTDARILNTQ